MRLPIDTTCNLATDFIQQISGKHHQNTKIRHVLAPCRCRDQPNRTIGCTSAAWSCGVSGDPLTQACNEILARVRACETSSTVGWPTLRDLHKSKDRPLSQLAGRQAKIEQCTGTEGAICCPLACAEGPAMAAPVGNVERCTDARLGRTRCRKTLASVYRDQLH